MASHRRSPAGRDNSAAKRSEARALPPSSLSRFAFVIAAATFCLIIAGALVVGNHAGLAVPDWPLSFGTLMPPMKGGVFYEHGHRMIAGAVAVLTLVLAVWIGIKEPRPGVRLLAWIAVGAVVLQAVLGGLTVLYRLPKPILIGHACLAQIFFCITLTLWLLTSPSWSLSTGTFEDLHSPSFRHLCAGLTAAIFTQLVLGAALRHGVIGFQAHVGWAFVVVFLVGWVLLRAMNSLPEQRPLQQLAITLGLLVMVQLALGSMSLLLRLTQTSTAAPTQTVIWVTTAHVATGALLLGISWVLTMLAFRRTRSLRAVAPLRQTAQKSPA